MQKLRADMDIGNNIQKARRNKGLTQDEVVAKLQIMGLRISRSTYAKIETNRINIRISELVALKSIFEVDYNYFFSGLQAEKEQFQNLPILIIQHMSRIISKIFQARFWYKK